jgi:hypothetical protein
MNFCRVRCVNCCDMRLLVDGWPTRQNKIEFVVLAEVINDSAHRAASHSFSGEPSRDARSRKVA